MALVLLPAFTDYPSGALLAVPSGSTAQRCRGALLQLDAVGAIADDPKIIDFSAPYDGLAAQLPSLDIEGAVIFDDALVLLHRGSRTSPLSALIELSLADVHAGFIHRHAIEALSPHCVRLG